ncbi:MAG TPA: N-acetylmuramoyl-L-alanine amidase, partial [Solirubrobacteraceae bacterium]|nr:N-acetylmuramoyl-L-alanine amidase [Solirubrobacteraceae bacterium]
MRDDGLTRRRALGLGAAAGLGALLARPLPALGRGTTAPRSFGLRVTAADFPGHGGVSRVLRTSRRFDLLGLRGPRGDVEVRVRRRDGRWSPWVPLAVHGDHAPDTGSGERASDPVWTGGSHELQLRAARPVRGTLRLHLVAVPAAARRRVRPRPVARAAQAAYPAPPPMVSRASWGADRVPPRADPSYGQVQVGFVHHTVNANDYGPQDSAAIVLAIAKYHRDTNGWNDIGYNFLIDRYGQVFEGRAGGMESPVVGAQAQGYNSVSTGIANLGTFSTAGQTAAGLQALARLLSWKL